MPKIAQKWGFWDFFRIGSSVFSDSLYRDYKCKPFNVTAQFLIIFFGQIWANLAQSHKDLNADPWKYHLFMVNLNLIFNFDKFLNALRCAAVWFILADLI